ncbi:WD repeat protein [Nostoc sp. NIES-3756]|uniref:WD40 repeat domain-containing protein n=1 Tax=Nostoc sp. NIES-3756 TaxID=1751286 RepID=UPI00071EF6E1|nr:WD40 repeat domain-containing protein [Nostoc sp. NIES-3756]BAT52818.1 WD repeat protein [Nostoc sp. NIES-3756]
MIQKSRWWTALSAIALTTSTIVSCVHTYPVIANPQPSTKQVNSPILTLSGHTAPIRAIALSADGQTLASGDDDKTIKVWNLKTGELRHTLVGHTERISSVAISPDGKTLISASHDKTIKVWDLATGKLLGNITGHKAAITAIIISPDGKTIASASMDQTVRLWNANNRRLRRSLKADAFSLAISPDGKTLYSGSNNGSIKLWNLSTGKLLRTLTPPLPKSPVFPFQRASRVLSLAISPNGQTLVNGSYDDTHQSIQQTDGTNIKIWDLKTRKVIHSFSVGIGSVDAVVISPDGKTFASGGLNRKISILDLQTGKLIRTLEGHAGGVYALAFSRDGKTLISGSGDKSIKVWQL